MKTIKPLPPDVLADAEDGPHIETGRLLTSKSVGCPHGRSSRAVCPHCMGLSASMRTNLNDSTDGRQ